LLRSIEDVVRLGHVRRIGRDEIILDAGRISTSPDTLHIHCAARALTRKPLRPVFEPGRVTVQPIAWSFACYAFATLGVVEATGNDDKEKNKLCPPLMFWDKDRDFLSAVLMTLAGERARRAHPVLGDWMRTTRLNPLNATSGDLSDPRVLDARERVRKHAPHAVANLQHLVRSS
jgi:hypothetical protein